jgi:flagellar hook assembly protein FlgD
LGFPLSISITWDGTDNRGHALAQGVYFVTVETAGESYTTKAVLLK